jgi:hypothetical protein
MDMQNHTWYNSFDASDITTNDEDNFSCQRLYLRIMYEQTIPAQNRFAPALSGGIVSIKPGQQWG